MKEQIGLNFAAALRSFLRQDPDIILVGEIRDFETAEIAVKAALTGHLVLSTLHTNDAPVDDQPPHEHGHRAVPRRDVGQPASARSASCAASARECTEDVETPAADAHRRSGSRRTRSRRCSIKRGRGCERCNNTGYKGRVGLYEVMQFTDEIREMILSGASAIELKRKAIEEGMITPAHVRAPEDHGRA